MTLTQSKPIPGLQSYKTLLRLWAQSIPQTVDPGTSRLLHLEIKMPPIDIVGWIKRQSIQPSFYWSDRQGQMECGAVGVAHFFRGSPQEPQFDFIAELKRILSAQPLSRYYGGFCFDPKQMGEQWQEFAASWFILPRFELRRQGDQTILLCHHLQKPDSLEKPESLFQDIDGLVMNADPACDEIPLPFSRKDVPEKSLWDQAVEEQLQKIQQKRLEKIVLARKSTFQLPSSINPFALVQKMRLLHPGCYHFCFSPNPGIAFFGASPERLFYRRNNHVETEALAGTRPRGQDSNQDRLFKEDLLSSSKDLFEQQIVTRYILEVLTPVCSILEIKKDAALLQLTDGQHLLSTFEGILHPGIDEDRLLSLLHPTPAVAGFPKKAALESIEQTEPFDRGWYAGPIGWIGNEESEFAVGIRSGLIKNKNLSLFSGAGIVEGSQPDAEWNEIENKMSSLLKVFLP